MEQPRKLFWAMTLAWWHEWMPSGGVFERVMTDLLMLEGYTRYSNDIVCIFNGGNRLLYLFAPFQ